MPRTLRSGATYDGPSNEHYGRHALRNSTLPGQRRRKKREVARPTTRAASSKSTTKHQPPLPSVPMTPPQKPPPRITRSGKPTCCHFGLLRRIRFPGYFFCGECDWWDNELSHRQALKGGKYDETKRPTRYACSANHNSWFFPTDKMLNCIPVLSDDSSNNKNIISSSFFTEDDDDDDDDDDDYDDENNNYKDDDDYDSTPDERLEEEDDGRTDCAALSGDGNEYDDGHEGDDADDEGSIKGSVKDRNKESSTASNDVPAVLKEVYVQIDVLQKRINAATRKASFWKKKYNNLAVIYTKNKKKRVDVGDVTDQLLSVMEKEYRRGGPNRSSSSRHRMLKLIANKLWGCEENNEQQQQQHEGNDEQQHLQQDKEQQEENEQDDDEQPEQHHQQVEHQAEQQHQQQEVEQQQEQQQQQQQHEEDESEFWRELRNCLLQKARKWLRKNVFSPDRILKAMDMKGGQLSMEGIEVLRKMECGNAKYSRNTVLPSSAEIKRAAAVVEEYANEVIPFKHGYLDDGGEYIEWVPEDMIKTVFKGFHLTDVSKQRSVRINQSIDGAQLSKRVTHVTYGFKVVDKAAICPFQGKPIFANPDFAIMQSRNLCFPLKIVMRRETKEIYSVFKSLFDKFKTFSTADSAEILGDNILPLDVAMNCDMSATWKGLGVGGAAKRDKMPCHACPIQSDTLVVPNPFHCNRWCQQIHSERPNWKCYHHEFFTEESIGRMMEEVTKVADEISSLIPDLDRLLKHSKIRLDEDPRMPLLENCQRDKLSIHFDFDDSSYVTQKERLAYSARITLDLKLRKLSINGSRHARRERLRESLIMEWTYRSLRRAIDHGNKGKESALFLLMDAVPCILHMENRVGLKMTTLLLIKGLGNAVKGKTFTQNDDLNRYTTERQRMMAFFERIENICNTEIWGSPDNPSQWECPRDEQKKQIGILCLDNNRTRVLVNELGKLVDVCIPDEPTRAKWNECVEHYIQSMELLRKKGDFTDDEITTFQCHVDLFFQDWVHLHGISGVTNYIHMMASGHISDYLFQWQNLYSHSQQGWESFNSLLKTFYFRRTGRGGAGNKGTSMKSKVMPIGRWLSRRAIWMCGTTFQEMKLAVSNKRKRTEGETTDEGDDDDDEVLQLIHE